MVWGVRKKRVGRGKRKERGGERVGEEKGRREVRKEKREKEEWGNREGENGRGWGGGGRKQRKGGY